MNMTKPMSLELDVEVEFTYYHGCDAVMYLSNGDPGYPAEPPEAEVQKVFIGTGKQRLDIYDRLTSEEIDVLTETILEDGVDIDICE